MITFRSPFFLAKTGPSLRILTFAEGNAVTGADGALRKEGVAMSEDRWSAYRNM
jgi:hypothetical protein